MEKLLREIEELVKDCFFEKYCDIDWHCDGGFEDKIMKRELKDLQWEVSDLITGRLKELDKDIEEWELDHEDEWNKKELEDIKTDMLYERNNDL